MIETIHLTKHFDTFVAVENVTVTVQPGEILALLGPNGAGKTTTVRMLTSILAPTAGTARIAGYDVVRDPEHVRANVGVLTEGHGLYLRQNGREYLEFFAHLYGLNASQRRTRAEELSSRFGLYEALDRRIGEYSKGMRQKLALVRAMMHNPPVLLLDEPTSAMDPHSARQVRTAIQQLRGDGRAIILTTHNLNEAEELADRIAIIRRGRIIEEGATLDLKTRLLGPPLLELRYTGEPDGVFEALSNLVEIDSHGHSWVRYRTASPQAVNPAVLSTAVMHGLKVITLSEVPQPLEDVYLRVVNTYLEQDSQ
ncbi:MAG: ABC transporter ATP-binding protein [Anaerolineae bacterium]|nr:ABC transporter ATP-binding protein [Anaerolineae bacterium]